MRKSIDITLQDGANSYIFRIKQMSATRAQSWLIRAGLLVTRGDVNLLDMDVEKMQNWLKQYGLSAIQRLEYEAVEPLLADLLACCNKVDGNTETGCTAEFIDSFVHDPMTLFTLQKKSFEVNFGFFIEKLAGLSASFTTSNTARQSKTDEASPAMPMSPTS